MGRLNIMAVSTVCPSEGNVDGGGEGEGEGEEVLQLCFWVTQKV